MRTTIILFFLAMNIAGAQSFHVIDSLSNRHLEDISYTLYKNGEKISQVNRKLGKIEIRAKLIFDSISINKPGYKTFVATKSTIGDIVRLSKVDYSNEAKSYEVEADGSIVLGIGFGNDKPPKYSVIDRGFKDAIGFKNPFKEQLRVDKISLNFALVKRKTAYRIHFMKYDELGTFPLLYAQPLAELYSTEVLYREAGDNGIATINLENHNLIFYRSLLVMVELINYYDEKGQVAQTRLNDQTWLKQHFSVSMKRYKDTDVYTDSVNNIKLLDTNTFNNFINNTTVGKAQNFGPEIILYAHKYLP